jgi:hypothetical protein
MHSRACPAEGAKSYSTQCPIANKLAILQGKTLHRSISIFYYKINHLKLDVRPINDLPPMSSGTWL